MAFNPPTGITIGVPESSRCVTLSSEKEAKFICPVRARQMEWNGRTWMTLNSSTCFLPHHTAYPIKINPVTPPERTNKNDEVEKENGEHFGLFLFGYDYPWRLETPNPIPSLPPFRNQDVMN
jgi:hypothetical protein